jgi:hypothetical protein
VARINHTPDSNPTRARARARRNINLVLWWCIALILLFLLSTGAPWIILLPLIVIGALVVTNTIQVVRGDGAEQYAIAPGRLVQATADADPVAVPVTRAPDRREKGRRRGTLHFAGGRLSFTFGPNPRSRSKTADDELEGTTIFDVWPSDIQLDQPPSTMRPQLVMLIDGTTHVIEFTMPEDLAAGMLGKVVAGEWYAQLADLGARTPRAKS